MHSLLGQTKQIQELNGADSKSHQVGGLNDKSIADAQRGVWRPHICLLLVIDIDSREGHLHCWVSVLEGVQYLGVHNVGQHRPVYHCLHPQTNVLQCNHECQ